MNSNHSTLSFRYEQKQNGVLHWKTQSHKERSTDCNINGTGISDNSFAFNFVLQKIYVFQNIQQQDGFQPPSHKIDALIYIK